MSALPLRLHLNNKSEPKKKNAYPSGCVHWFRVKRAFRRFIVLYWYAPEVEQTPSKRFILLLSSIPLSTHGSTVRIIHHCAAYGNAKGEKKLNTCWENGFWWHGKENKMLLMYLVKVKKRRKCKFTPYNKIMYSFMHLDRLQNALLYRKPHFTTVIVLNISERNRDNIFIISVVGVVEKENIFCVSPSAHLSLRVSY